MKRSHAVSIALVSHVACAALASGCGSSSKPQPQGWQTCVDRAQNTAVEQRYCDDEAKNSSSPGYRPHYGWYYYPRSYYWQAPAIGARIPDGGSFSATPHATAPMARTGSVVRGGLGSTAAGHASSGS